MWKHEIPINPGQYWHRWTDCEGVTHYDVLAITGSPDSDYRISLQGRDDPWWNNEDFYKYGGEIFSEPIPLPS